MTYHCFPGHKVLRSRMTGEQVNNASATQFGSRLMLRCTSLSDPGTFIDETKHYFRSVYGKRAHTEANMRNAGQDQVCTKILSIWKMFFLCCFGRLRLNGHLLIVEMLMIGVRIRNHGQHIDVGSHSS